MRYTATITPSDSGDYDIADQHWFDPLIDRESITSALFDFDLTVSLCITYAHTTIESIECGDFNDCGWLLTAAPTANATPDEVIDTHYPSCVAHLTPYSSRANTTTPVDTAVTLDLDDLTRLLECTNVYSPEGRLLGVHDAIVWLATTDQHGWLTLETSSHYPRAEATGLGLGLAQD